MSAVIYRRANSPFLYRHDFKTNTVESICSAPETLRFEQYRAMTEKSTLVEELIDEEADFLSEADYAAERFETIKKIVSCTH